MAIILPLTTACDRKYGKRVKFGKMEVYYKKPVTKQMAKDLGKFLLREKLGSDDRRTSFQLLKPDGRLQFRMVVKEGIEEEKAIHLSLRLIVEKMSGELFKGEPVDMHLCDNKFNTLVEYPYHSVHMMNFKKGRIVYEAPITKKTVEALGNFLVKEKFFTNKKEIGVHLTKEKGRLKFRYDVIDNQWDNPKYIEIIKLFMKQISKAVLNNAPLDAVFLDSKLNVKREVLFQ
ncbi:hypothetical protein KKF84_08700 [Myxococcota bacterium]|nr:hypothetical protein [Myxococcota bacterium]